MKRMRKDDIGAIGIGTLIIFIALILVAAIAAAVIIRTAEDLEEDAQRQGEGAREDVSGGLQMETIEGNVAAGSINQLRIYVTLYGGSADLDTTGIVVHMVVIPQTGAATSDDYFHEFGVGGAGATGPFDVVEISDPNNAYTDAAAGPHVIDQDALLRFDIDAASSLTIAPNSDVHISLIQAPGGPTMTAKFSTPATYPTSGYVNLDN